MSVHPFFPFERRGNVGALQDELSLELVDIVDPKTVWTCRRDPDFARERDEAIGIDPFAAQMILDAQAALLQLHECLDVETVGIGTGSSLV